MCWGTQAHTKEGQIVIRGQAGLLSETCTGWGSALKSQASSQTLKQAAVSFDQESTAALKKDASGPGSAGSSTPGFSGLCIYSLGSDLSSE